jgi:hypothetical protein
VTPKEALDYAVFAVSNHTDPDASTEEDVARLEKNADEIKAALIRLRDYVIASGEDLPDWVLDADKDRPAPASGGGRARKVTTAPGMDPGRVAALGIVPGRVAEEIAAKVIHPAFRVTNDPALPIQRVRPLSDFAIHFGLVPVNAGDGPAYIRDNGAKVHGGDDDLRLAELPGAYVNGDWEVWGEYAENGTTHIVWDLPEDPWTSDFGVLLGGFLLAVKNMKGPGRLSDVAIITDKADHSIAAGMVYIGGDDPNLDVVVPRDWRTR